MEELYGIGEASLYVDDLDDAQEWYTEVLGLEAGFEGEGFRFLHTGEERYRQRVILFDPAETEGQDVPPSHGAEGPSHVAFAVTYDSLDDWRDRLAEHEVEVEEELSWPGGDESIYFRDPAGNSLELYGEVRE